MRTTPLKQGLASVGLKMLLLMLPVLFCTSGSFAQYGVNSPYFNPNDPGYGSGEGLSLPANVTAIAVQPNGRVIIGGAFATYNGSDESNIARLLPNGTLDASFSVSGAATGAVINGIAVQPDGKVIVVGNFSTFGTSTVQNVVRLNPNGAVDLTFGGGSLGNGADNVINDVLVDPDGNIFLVGTFSGSSFNNAGKEYIVKLNSSGVVDAAFTSGADAPITKIARQSTGKLIITGLFTDYAGAAVGRIARLNADGTPDLSFNQDGNGLTNGAIRSLQVASDDRVLVVGEFGNYNGEPESAILLYTDADGARNTNFGFPFPPDGGIFSATFAADGKVIIAGGFENLDGEASADRLARLNADGSVDNSFVIGLGPDATVRQIIPNNDGKWLIAGSFETYNSISRVGFTRLLSNGQPDLTFNPITGANGTVFNVFYNEQTDRYIFGGAFTSYNGVTNTNGIVVVAPDGSVDPSFAVNSNFEGVVTVSHVQADGKILIAGTFYYPGSTSYGIARLNADGTLDNTFNNGGDGVEQGPFPTITAIHQLSNGEILVGGTFNTYNEISVSGFVRLSSTGSIISSGGPNVAAITAIAVNDDETKIAVVGAFTSFNGTPRNGLVVLNNSGTVDASFVPATNPGDVFAAAYLPSGDLLVGGDGNLFAFTPTGALKPAYPAGVGSNVAGTIRGIEVAEDGTAIVVGEFTSVAGAARTNIAKIRVDGTVDPDYLPDSGSNGVIYSAAYNSTVDYMIIGGDFTAHDGRGRNRVTLLLNTPLALPIKLQSFTGRAVGEKVELQWTTATESDNDYFTVERSTDARNWTVIGTVPGSGTTSTAKSYRLVDPFPVKGLQYYRLKQTDLNGRFTYFDRISVTLGTVNSKPLNIYPNPVGATLNLVINGDHAATSTVRIYDFSGRLVQTYPQLSGTQFNLNVATLRKGMYVVDVQSGNQHHKTNMVKD